VAVANSGTNRVMTSPDGITWTARTSANETLSWSGVTYGNSQFVAVGYSGTNMVMTSPDGITWTSRSAANEGQSQPIRVTYGNGMYVMLQNINSNRIQTSSDGINWTARTSPVDTSNWDAITYGGGQFVALSNNGSNRVMISPDGINWKAYASSNESNGWLGIAYGNGTFVGVASGGTNRVMTMSPPVNWGGLLANNYGSISSSGSDPAQGGSTIRYQNYITHNNFTSRIDTAIGEYAEYDFDLDFSKATYQSTYCFRVVNADGSAINTYNTYPEITRCTVPTLSLRMRHNDAFCAGARSFFWSSAGS
jgi:hypothetical protein